jgi:hypothetical protein
MATTLCGGMDTLGMVATPIEDSKEVLFCQPPVIQIFADDIPFDHLSVDLLVGAFVDGVVIGQPLVMAVPPWHVEVAKFYEILTHPPINEVRVLLNVVVVWNQEGIFQMKGPLRQ